MMREKFIFYNTEFSFNLMSISKVFRINVNKLDKIVDFDNRVVVKLTKHKGHLRLCSMSNKIKADYPSIVSLLKSDYEFMSQLMNIIGLIYSNYHPRVVDYTNITGDENDYLVCDNPLSENNVVIKWFNDFETEEGKLLITIF